MSTGPNSPDGATQDLWTLPVLSQEFRDGPMVKLNTDACVLSYDYETPDGSYAWEAIGFQGVHGFSFTGHDACTEVQVAAYDRLVEVIDSPWVAELRSQSLYPVEGLRHLRIYFDEVGCYELAAIGFEPPPKRSEE